MRAAIKAPVSEQLDDYWADELSEQVKGVYFDFVQNFYQRFPLEDLGKRQHQDMAACLRGLWRLLQHDPMQMQIDVFNPNVEEHGWSCGRTVIAVSIIDQPFLVDSIRIELNKREIPIHVIKSTLLTLARDEKGSVINDSSGERSQKEALVYIEAGLLPEKNDRQELKAALNDVLKKLAMVVKDYPQMLSITAEMAKQLQQLDNPCSAESAAFLEWLRQSHFTFIGYREFDLVGDKDSTLKENTEARLGLFHDRDYTASPDPLISSKGSQEFYAGSKYISFSKSSKRSDVHRAIYPNYIVVKRIGKNGKVVGEGRLLGFFTYSVYNDTPFDIPLVREKVQAIVQRSGLEINSHDGKNLQRIIETFPRDELFQADEDILSHIIISASCINERRVVRLFILPDSFNRFLTTMVYIPRDVFNTNMREKIERYIASKIHALKYDSNTFFSESILARAHTTFLLGDELVDIASLDSLEDEIIDLVRAWDDHFESALIDAHGEANGLRCFRKYRHSFSSSYKESFDARETVHDIKLFESLNRSNDIAMHFFQTITGSGPCIRFKVMRLDTPIELSDVIPILENLGLRVVGEHPYKIAFDEKNGKTKRVLMHDFSLRSGVQTPIDMPAVQALFEQAFAAVWGGEAQSDGFNRLVLTALLNWREVVLLRAYASYMKQTLFNFSLDYIAEVLTLHPDITQRLVEYFHACFDPEKIEQDSQALEQELLLMLDDVKNLNEDRILRRYVEFINGTLRTNFYRKDDKGLSRSYCVFKFSPQEITGIPEPRPNYEIYVYSPRVEGVHLRGSKVARGGLRWSDRFEDYRTEVLGLVKAQQVKNAVIVPSGAKGGFISKQTPSNATRDEQLKEGIECYKTFISGLLDVTDNYIDGEVVVPEQVVRKDGDDPYLVVAADKGTATFSDIANEISLAKNHWLGDAFASGGSQGYDHKAMGITAKGAWVSVQRHFREKGVDIQTEDFTVVGVGDMAGDVFGNGMLLSEHICLCTAFNHMHIFIDPTPDSKTSFQERKRLFELPRSSWTDYNTDLISKGGGIFSRADKSITLTPQMKKVFDIKADKLAPNDLIHAILKSPVDLVWNGGIGTYVKSTEENHSDVGDKANDCLRVNGSDLRCKVFGEGGNLGMTQLGRIEFSLSGGACNTDFIDNAAGVDCSDHEVNIKILLDEVVQSGDLTQKQRNQLLEDMTQSVSDLVLKNNYRQTQCLSFAEYQIASRKAEYRRLMIDLEEQGRLNRALEFLPEEEKLLEREAQGQHLTRPELSVLLSYAKVMLKEEFAQCRLDQDDYLVRASESAFPERLREGYSDKIYSHRLLPEIVATQIANDFINNLGITAAHRMIDSTGANLGDIAKAYVTARDIFWFEQTQELIASLDNKVSAEIQMGILGVALRRVRRGTRWFLKNRRDQLNPANEVGVFSQSLNLLVDHNGLHLSASAKEAWQARYDKYQAIGLNDTWCRRLALPDNLFAGLGVVDIAITNDVEVVEAFNIFYQLHDHLQTDWLAVQISSISVHNIWQAKARESMLDELEIQVRRIAGSLLKRGQGGGVDIASSTPGYERWLSLIAEIKSSTNADFAMFSVVIGELLSLAASIEAS